jgi:RND family efflux transporter MFP subunit
MHRRLSGGFLVPALLHAGVGCSQEPPEVVLPPPQVSVSKPVARVVVDHAEATGRTDAVETYEVRVRVKGFLKAVKFREGSLVKKNQPLYEIDPRTFEADLESAQAETDRLRAQLKQAKSEAERAAFLRQMKSVAVSEEEYVQKVAAQEAAAAALRKAVAAVRTAELELSFTKINSPIDGVISRTLVTEGNLVGYNEPTLLTTVVRIDPIYVYFDLTERAMLEYDRLVRDQAATAFDARVPVHVGLAIDKGHPHKGHIDFRDNRVDPGTGTIRLRAVIDNKAGLLTPGLFCRVKLPIGLPQQRLLVAESALGLDQRGRFVLVVGADDVVDVHMVQVGAATDDGLVVIERGLGPNDVVIVNGLQRARPGSKVAPKHVPMVPPTGK